MNYQTSPYHSGKIIVLGDLHYESYRRFSLNPIDQSALQDIVWNADALILAGDLTNGPADRCAQVFQYLSEFILPERVNALPGNHDYCSGHLIDDQVLERVTKIAGAHFLQKTALLNGDTRIFCCTLWTDFNLSGGPSIAVRNADLLMSDYDPIGAPRHCFHAIMGWVLMNQTPKQYLSDVEACCDVHFADYSSPPARRSCNLRKKLAPILANEAGGSRDGASAAKARLRAGEYLPNARSAARPPAKVPFAVPSPF